VPKSISTKRSLTIAVPQASPNVCARTKFLKISRVVYAARLRSSMRACNQLTRRTLERSPSIESERRLFYVGITRARTRCIVSCGANISGIETRSRFLRDAMEVPKPARLR
jgi:ATP-dependent exoDNAse (exonuclease V) beta subunit